MRKDACGRTLLALALVPLLLSRANADPMYSVTDIGTLPGGTSSRASGINSHGQVVGEADGNRPFLWSNGHISPLAAGPDNPLAINDAGQIVGTGGGSPSNIGYDINNHGDRVGQTFLNTFLYENGVMNMIYADVLSGINNFGVAVGTNFGHPVIFDLHSSSPPTGTSPGPVGGYYLGFSGTASAINDSGMVVGFAFDGVGHGFAFLDGKTTNLGNGFWPSSVNNAGQIVGGAPILTAMLYQGGTLYNLNQLIPAGSGWVLEDAKKINDAGQIVGYGTIDGHEHGFLLTPMAATVPEPGTLAWSAAALLCVVAWRSRAGREASPYS